MPNTSQPWPSLPLPSSAWPLRSEACKSQNSAKWKSFSPRVKRAAPLCPTNATRLVLKTWPAWPALSVVTQSPPMRTLPSGMNEISPTHQLSALLRRTPPYSSTTCSIALATLSKTWQFSLRIWSATWTRPLASFTANVSCSSWLKKGWPAKKPTIWFNQKQPILGTTKWTSSPSWKQTTKSPLA